MKINKKRICIVLVGLLLILVGSRFLIFNVTPSLPRGMYLLLPAKDIQRGDLVIFDIPEHLKECQYIPKFTDILLKEVGAIENDKVEIREESIYINEKKYGNIYKQDSLGEKLPQLSQKQLQPLKGDFLPLAPALNSYDGRYYGTVKITEIKNKAKLIIKI